MEQTYTIKTEQTIKTNEQMMECFNKNFLSQISSDADFDVEFLGVDVVDGFLDVKVTSHFKYPYALSFWITQKQVRFIRNLRKNEREKKERLMIDSSCLTSMSNRNRRIIEICQKMKQKKYI